MNNSQVICSPLHCRLHLIGVHSDNKGNENTMSEIILRSPLGWPGVPGPDVPEVSPLHGVEAGGRVVGRVQAPGVSRAVTPRRAVGVSSSASEHVSSGAGECPVIPLTETAHVSVICM